MQEKNKILIIGPGMEIGGVERSLLGLLDSVDYSENEVDLFLYAHTGELMPYINKNVNLLPENQFYTLMKLQIAELLKKGHFYTAAVRLFSKLYGDARSKITRVTRINTTLCRKILTKHVPILEKQYDIAYSFFQPHYFVEEKVTAKVKIGWVHTDYSNKEEKPDKKFLLPMWEKLDQIACVSESVKATFDTVYPELSNKTIIIENQLPIELIRKQAAQFDASEEMPRDGSFRILSVGRFCTAKAFDEAIIAAKKLHDAGINIKWYFIGYGPDEALMKNIIDEQNSGAYTIILGKKTNPYPYMLACDLYAQPSRYEGKAVTVCEAQLLGKPVLITNYATAASQLSESGISHVCDMGIDGICDGVRYMMDRLQ